MILDMNSVRLSLRAIAWTFAALAVGACAQDDDPSAGDETEGTLAETDESGDAQEGSGGESGGESGRNDSSSEPGAPTILNISSNTQLLSDIETLTVTAVVSDPDGIDDLIGGVLESPQGASYGAFQTSSSEGSYQMSLQWADLSTVSPLRFESSTELVLVARFFDVAGHQSSAELTISLECDDEDSQACGESACSSMSDVETCGSCDFGCADAPELTGPDSGYGISERACSAGGCEVEVVTYNPTAGRSCADVCDPWDATAARFDGADASPNAPHPDGYGMQECTCRFE